MSSKKATLTGMKQARKLRFHKETLKDLDSKAKSEEVKNGAPIIQYTVMLCTTVCFPPNVK